MITEDNITVCNDFIFGKSGVVAFTRNDKNLNAELSIFRGFHYRVFELDKKECNVTLFVIKGGIV